MQLTLRSSKLLSSAIRSPFSATLLVALLLPATVGSRSVDTPNLLLITCDTMRADYLSIYGGQTPTPAMQQLADAGVLFEQSYSLAPWTLPSMQGIFSSRYPLDLPVGGTRDEWTDIMIMIPYPSSEPTLAERLAERGYATAGFVGNAIMGRTAEGVLAGFDQMQMWPHEGNRPAGVFAQLPGLHSILARISPALAPERPINLTRILSDFGSSFIARKGGQPFFLWVHFMDPHDPYTPVPKFQPEEFASYASSNSQSGDHAWHDTRFSAQSTRQDQEAARHFYRGEIRAVDEAIGSLLKSLEDEGLTENTYVCLTADHGEELNDHGGWYHGQSVYDELVRVPLIFSGPGISKGLRIAAPVSAIDVTPTLADLFDMDPGADWQGFSLSPELTGAGDSRIERPCYAGSSTVADWPNVWRMVRKGDFKLIEIETEETKDYLLFDLTRDSGEKADLSAERPGLLEEMKVLLSQGPQRQSNEIQTLVDSESEETILRRKEELRALGYLD